MIYYGRFTRYIPETFPEGFPEEMKDRVIWLRNEAGEDLYELRKQMPEGHSFVVTEDDNSVRVVQTDPHMVFPSEGGHLYAVEGGFESNPTALMKKLFDPATGGLVDRPPTVPTKVSAAQATQALYDAGLLDELETVIAEHPYRPVQLWYARANEWERAHPYVAMLAPELNLTEEQIDALFIAASKK